MFGLGDVGNNSESGMDIHSSKRKKTRMDLCIVCGQYEGKKRNDRVPIVLSLEEHNHLIELLELPLEFLIQREVKAHKQCCRFPSYLKKFIVPGGSVRADVATLRKIFQQHSSEVQSPMQLDTIFEGSETFEKGLLQLKLLKAVPYSFTFLPAELFHKLDEEHKARYIEQCEKLQYDILLSQLSHFETWKRGRQLKIRCISKDSRGYVFQHFKVANLTIEPSQRTEQKQSQVLRKVAETSQGVVADSDSSPSAAHCVGHSPSQNYLLKQSLAFTENIT